MLSYILVFFLLTSAIGIVVTARICLLAYTSRHWVKTRAVIITSELGQGWSGETSKKYYRPIIRYRYTYGNYTYECDNFDFQTDNLSEQRAKSRLRNYYLGREIEAYVNPKKPKTGVIKAGLQGWHLFSFFVCWAMFLGSLYSLSIL